MGVFNRTSKTVPVVIEEKLDRNLYVILFTRNEGERYEVHVCTNELEADNYMKEFERSGLFIRLNHTWHGGKELIEPIAMLKTKAIKAVRKEFRVVTMEDEDIIDSE